MSKKKLFDDDSDEEIDLKTENEYAKKYDSWREKEEIHKLEQKYGPDGIDPDGSDSSDSDEPPEVSEEVEEQFLTTLALLKTKDPRIYDPNFKCFKQEEEKKSEEKSKPKTLTFDDSDEDDDDGDIFKIEKKAEIDDDSEKQNVSNEPTMKKKEKKIKEYLTGKADHVDEEVEKDLAPLKALWSDPKLNEGEAFLRDYILNKRYLDDDEGGESTDRLRDDLDLEADEQTVEEQSKFERAYNFRFEEPDDEYLKRFPRTMSSLRPKDERRSRKRAELRARKDDDKKRKMDEIARLKALKLKEIQQKIARIKEVTGNEELAFKEEDIEGDFDPEEHDRRMRALFDEQYYGDADNEKPVFPDLDEELEIENWDKYDVNAEPRKQLGADDGPHCEDDDFNMDADFDPRQPRAALIREVQKTLGSGRRSRRRKSKLAALLANDKPKFVPDAQKTYDQYMEEYYQMDCEDVLGGDLPTRFKYRQVVPNDYGLTVEEILLADDRELTQWVPLKKIVKHRPDNVEKGEVKTYAQKAADVRLKRKVLPSLFRDLPEEPELVVPVEEVSKNKKKKKKKNKEKTVENANVVEDNDGEVTEQRSEEDVQGEKKQKKKKKKGHNPEHADISGNQEQTAGDTLTDKITLDIKQNKLKETNSENDIDEPCLEKDVNRKKKNKKKKSMSEENNIPTEEVNIVANNEYAAAELANNKKNKKRNQTNGEVNNDSSVHENVQNNLVEKKNKHKTNTFVVEKVTTQVPSQESSLSIQIQTKKPNKNDSKPGQGVKRKLESQTDSFQHKKSKQDIGKGRNDFKSKLNQKDKFNKKKQFNKKHNNDTSNDNPLSKLSDERLKAYGLNPKKYKNFLKYKKF